MSIHAAVTGSLHKLTDKGKSAPTDHRIEALKDGTFIHSITRDGEEERHTHSSIGKVISCLREAHAD